MASAVFFINHVPTDSRVLVEFTLINGKVKMTGTNFVKGKVVDLGTVRACREEAKRLLHEFNGDPNPTSAG